MKENNFWEARDEMVKICKSLEKEIRELYISEESLEARVKNRKVVNDQISKLMNDHGTQLEELVEKTRILADKLESVMSKAMKANGY